MIRDCLQSAEKITMRAHCSGRLLLDTSDSFTRGTTREVVCVRPWHATLACEGLEAAGGATRDSGCDIVN